MELYHVNIDSDNYFEANSLEIRPGVRIVDIRSLRGHIVIDFDAKDVQLKRLIHEYISTADNVELINILSREYNEYNWFEAYDESYNSNQVYTKNQLLSSSVERKSERSELLEIQNNEVAGNPATLQIVKIERFIKSVRSIRGDKLLPNNLYTNLHKGIPRNQKLDLESLDFTPIWYINGKTNDAKCELFCCFEITLHILAKRFVDFKAKLLQLASTDIQLAKAKNQTLERYQHLTQLELIDKIEKLIMKKQGLKKKNKSLEEKLDEMNAKLDTQTQALNEANTKLDTQTQELAQAQVSLNEANAKLDASAQREEQLQNTMNHLQDVVIESAQMLNDELHNASETVRKEFTKMNVTTSSRAETIDVWEIKELDDYYHQTHQCNENERVLDTYCGDATKPSRINQHRFKPQANDRLIGSYPNANAIDLAVFLRRHREHYPHVRMDSNRKLIYSNNEIEEVKSLLEAYSDEGDGRVIEVVDSFELRSQNAGNQLITHLQAIFNQQQANAQQIEALNANVNAQAIAIAQLQEQEQAHHQEQQQANAHIQAQLDNIQEQLTTFQLFKQKHPHAHQHLHRRWYRDVNEDEEGRAWCEDLKGGARYYLTEDDINRGRFR